MIVETNFSSSRVAFSSGVSFASSLLVLAARFVQLFGRRGSHFAAISFDFFYSHFVALDFSDTVCPSATRCGCTLMRTEFEGEQQNANFVDKSWCECNVKMGALTSCNSFFGLVDGSDSLGARIDRTLASHPPSSVQLSTPWRMNKKKQQTRTNSREKASDKARRSAETMSTNSQSNFKFIK